MPIQFDQTTAGVLTLQAPASGSYTLQLPSGNGSSNQYLVSDGTGGLSWADLNGLQNITPALNTASPNNTVNVSSLSATGGTTDVFFALSTSANGGTVQAAVADSTATGGNSRGSGAFDFQMFRTAATQVASGLYSSIVGGYGNTASGAYALVIGGKSNIASTSGSFIGGGELNSVSATNASIIGGYSNSIGSSGTASVIIGGRANTIDMQGQTILGGYGGSANGVQNITVFPSANPIGASTSNALIGYGCVGSSYYNANAQSGYAYIDGGASATATNQLTLRTNSVYFCLITTSLYETYYPLYTSKTGHILLRRGSTAASTTVVAGGGDGTVVYKNNTFNDYLHIVSGADTTYGALQLSSYSGQVNHTLSTWVGIEYIYLQY